MRTEIVFEHDVPIEVDDGTLLRADVFRPSEEGRYPVLLSAGPYGKGLAFEDAYRGQWHRLITDHPDVAEGSTCRYQNWETSDPEKWVPDGYVCVRADSRGAGRSPGRLDPFSPRETLDLFACIEWAGTQPWSNGKVGLQGISYYAINQWQVAALQPPHLAAICPWEGAADWYRDMTHHGGIVCTFWENWYRNQVLTVQHGRGDQGPRSRVTGDWVAGPVTFTDEELEANRVDMRADILEHSVDDDYYSERSVDWERVKVPFLSAGNWGGAGLHLRGNVEGFARAASDQKWLEMHGLEHWTHFYTDYGRALQKRFFDYFLKAEDTGWSHQPNVLLQVRTVDGFIERHEEGWPIPRTAWTRLYLNAGESSLSTEPTQELRDVKYHARGDGVTFFTAQFEDETEITGPLSSKLFVSSATTDADLFLVLRLFDPHGEEVVMQGALDPHTPLAQGWLRASHRKLDVDRSLPWRPYHSHDEIQPLVPGQVYELDVEIWPTSMVVPSGYRLALTIRGRDYEYEGAAASIDSISNEMRGCGAFLHDDPADRREDIFGGTIAIHTGSEFPSHVLLPVIPPPG